MRSLLFTGKRVFCLIFSSFYLFPSTGRGYTSFMVDWRLRHRCKMHCNAKRQPFCFIVHRFIDSDYQNSNSGSDRYILDWNRPDKRHFKRLAGAMIHIFHLRRNCHERTLIESGSPRKTRVSEKGGIECEKLWAVFCVVL